MVSSAGVPQGLCSPLSCSQGDLHRPRPHLQAASTEGVDVEVVRASTEGVDVEVIRASTEGVDVEVIRASKHLGLLLEHRLDWSANTDPL